MPTPHVLPGIHWPIIALGPETPLLNLMAELAALDRFSPEALRIGQEQQLRELSRHFAEHCPLHYASHFPVTEMRTSVLDRLGGDGAHPSPWRTRAGVGLTHNLANGTEVSLRYDAESRSDFINQGASIKARWAF